ncbi:MAG: FecR domain-containing protein [Chloroflexota bacterium]
MKRPFFIVLVLVGSLLMAGAYVFAQPTGAGATLLVAQGEAVVFQSSLLAPFNQNTQRLLMAGEVLTVRQGDRIEVAAASTAVLTMPDGSSAELTADTTVELSELVSTQSAFRVRFMLMTGRMLSRVERLSGADDAYEVRTPSSTASVRGTLFAVHVLAADSTLVSVAEGTVAVNMDGQEVLVTAGYEVTAVTGQPLIIQPQSGQTQPSTSSADPVVGEPAAVSNPQTAANGAADSQNTASAETEPGESTDQKDDGGTAVSPMAPSSSPVSSGSDASEPAVQPTRTPVSPAATSIAATAGASPAATAGASPAATAGASPAATRILPTNPPPLTATPVPQATATTAPPLTATPQPPPTATPQPPPTATLEPPPTATAESAKVTICHNGRTIEVAPAAVQAFLAQGATLGPCP